MFLPNPKENNGVWRRSERPYLKYRLTILFIYQFTVFMEIFGSVVGAHVSAASIWIQIFFAAILWASRITSELLFPHIPKLFVNNIQILGPLLQKVRAPFSSPFHNSASVMWNSARKIKAVNRFLIFLVNFAASLRTSETGVCGPLHGCIMYFNECVCKQQRCVFVSFSS